MTRLIVLSFCLLTSASLLFGDQDGGARGGELGNGTQATVKNQAQLRRETMEDMSILKKMLKRINQMNSSFDSDLQSIADSMLCESRKAIS